MMNTRTWIAVLLTVIAYGVSSLKTGAAVVIYGSTADANPQDSTNPADGIGDGVFDAGKNALRAGAYEGGPYRRAAVFAFDLPTLAPGEVLASANFSARYFAKFGSPTYNVDLYAIRVGTAGSAVQSSDYGAGPSPSGTLLQLDFLTPSSSTVRTSTDDTADTALTQFLKANWIDGGRLFLRANPDTVNFSDNGSGGTLNEGYDFGSSDRTDGEIPILELQYIPEPSVTGLILLGSLMLCLRNRHRC